MESSVLEYTTACIPVNKNIDRNTMLGMKHKDDGDQHNFSRQYHVANHCYSKTQNF